MIKAQLVLFAAGVCGMRGLYLLGKPFFSDCSPEAAYVMWRAGVLCVLLDLALVFWLETWWPVAGIYPLTT